MHILARFARLGHRATVRTQPVLGCNCTGKELIKEIKEASWRRNLWAESIVCTHLKCARDLTGSLRQVLRTFKLESRPNTPQKL